MVWGEFCKQCSERFKGESVFSGIICIALYSISLIKVHSHHPKLHVVVRSSFLTFHNWRLPCVSSEHSIKLMEGNDDEDETYSVIVISLPPPPCKLGLFSFKSCCYGVERIDLRRAYGM